MLPVVLNCRCNLRGAGTEGAGLSGVGKLAGIVGGSKSSSSSDKMVGYCLSSSSVSDMNIS